MLIVTLPNCLPSIMLLVSRANDDIVVSDPKNPTAANSEYLASRFHMIARIENMPRIKLPATLMMKMLTGERAEDQRRLRQLVPDKRAGDGPCSEKREFDSFHSAHHVFYW